MRSKAVSSKWWLGVGALGLLSLAAPAQASPQLYADKWVEITPPGVVTGSTETCIGQGMAIDPQNPSTIYWGNTPFQASAGGLFKSEDGGSNWRRVAKVTPAFPGASDYLDEPLHVRIDPNDSKHLYAGDGVRGSSQGFFISHDGGETFERPQGFSDALKTEGIDNSDIYDLAVDPSNFNHILLSWHYRWGWDDSKWMRGAGIFESRDGGLTWIAHNPVPGAEGAGDSIKFLYSPDLKTGDSNTWLFGAQEGGFHRTTDGGNTWTKVSDVNITHGGSDTYYAKSGWLYTSGVQTLRSHDNGVTWEPVGPATSSTVGGDGDRLYSGGSFSQNAPMQVSPEMDGATWTAFNDQKFGDGPYALVYDQYYGILYASEWSSGVWALKANAGSGKVPPLTAPIPLPPVPAGGGAASAGASSMSAGGVASVGGAADAGGTRNGVSAMPKVAPDNGGCACRYIGGKPVGWGALAALLLAGLSVLRRRRPPR
jgi:MYXO-CTERM domain-containing protein